VQVDEQTFTVVMDARMGAVTSAFQGTVAKTVEEPPHHLTAAVHLWDSKTASILTGEFDANLVAETPQITRVEYRCDLTLRGRLMQAEPALAQPALEAALERFVECVRARIQHPTGVAMTPPAVTLQQRFNQAIQELFKKIRQI
jgi:carbon monoxide dehydrogenase subunit G